MGKIYIYVYLHMLQKFCQKSVLAYVRKIYYADRE